jgi:tRNA modification GTPase
MALNVARAELEAAQPFLGRDGDATLASHHVRRAILALDELIGVVDVEEVLDRVFAGFCVGK